MLQYSWTTAHVLAPLFIGLALLTLFVLWELYFAKYPMVPRALFSKDKQTMAAVLVISFFSGAGYVAVILFWPPQSYNVYGEWERVPVFVRLVLALTFLTLRR